MQVTFLEHSGFLVELDAVCLLFDWWKGALPPLPDKPLVVFASHRHGDHYDPHIFDLGREHPDARYLLSRDIRLGPKRQAALGLDAAFMNRIRFLRPEETLELPEAELTVEALHSTDEGVAFLVRCQGKTVYHAGDLNWWHWEGEDKAWNRNMEVNFKRYIQPLAGRSIDLAMLPLDSRLGAAYDWGFCWLLEQARVAHAIPMHLWEDFSAVSRFLDTHPALADRIVPVERNGQNWAFPE